MVSLEFRPVHVLEARDVTLHQSLEDIFGHFYSSIGGHFLNIFFLHFGHVHEMVHHTSKAVASLTSERSVRSLFFLIFLDIFFLHTGHVHEMVHHTTEFTSFLIFWIFFLVVIRNHTKFRELFLDELDWHLESSFFSHSVDFFSRDILLLDEILKDFEPFTWGSVRNTMATSSTTMSLATLFLSMFRLFWKNGNHHNRVLAWVLDLQKGMRMRKSLFTL